MTSSFRLAAFFFWLVVLNVSAAPPAGYYEVWGDEFSGTSLDPNKWWVWNQPDRSGYTVPDAVTLGGGYLTIHTYTTNGIHYSAIISSDQRFRARYGYSEASVEFNGSPGMFSDFWMISPNSGYIIGDPAAEGVEIDVCEHRVTDANDADDISGVVTIDLHWNGATNTKTDASGYVGSGLGTGFHTYGVLWSTTNYSFNIDGVPTWSTNTGISQRTEEIMLSCEVDSNSFCGIVPTNGYGNFLVSTTSTVFDYVRFYAPTTTVYWTGVSSVNWADGGNWLSNMIPVSASDVVFSFLSVGNCGITLGQDTTVNSLSIEEAVSPISISGNALTVGAGGIDMLSAVNDASISSTLVLSAAQSWPIAPGHTLVINAPISGPGSLTLPQMGTVVIAGTNTCSGPTTITSGTLQVSGLITNAVTVSGGTLTGTGTVTGPVLVNINSFLSPGPAFGTLAISNTLALQSGSQITFDINKSTGASDKITGLTSVTYGGTLVVNNQSGVLAAGDSFQLFQSGNYSGAFSRITPSSPGANLAWDLSALATNGMLRVISTTNAQIAAQLTGSQVTLSWPWINPGWRLQTQTNSPRTGLTTNWVTVPGSPATNRVICTINSNVGSVYFRLASPPFTNAVFGNGDLVVLQVGNGSINSTGAPGFLNDYLTIGGPIQAQVALPKTGANALIFGGSSYDGALSLSADGQFLVIPGYNVPTGYSSGPIDSSSTGGTNPVPRAVGSVDGGGNFMLNATTAKFSGSTIRSAMADGNGNFWAGGGSSGIVYLGSNSPAATLSSVSTATRDLLFANGNIFFTETGSGQDVMAFTGAPINGSTPALLINTAGTGTGTPSPKGLAFNSTMTIAYVADNRTAANGGGIQRFNWNGNAWIYAYTLGYTLTSSQEVYDLAVDFSGPNPVLYATTGESTANHIVTVTDIGSNSAYTTLETAPSGDAFRGITFAPGGP